MSRERHTVAVTGAFGTLGLAVSRHFVAAGAQLVLIDHATASKEIEGEFDGHMLLNGVDLTDSASVAKAFDAIRERFGVLDGLVNIAGGFKWETLVNGSLDTWDHLYAINLKTAVCASRAALPLLLARGRGGIVNIGAASSVKAGIGMGAYAASKAGVARFTESLAEELKDQRITVNAVLPGIIDTPQNRLDMPNDDVSRWVAPASIAAVIHFLLSSSASAVTGALIPVTNRC